LRTKALAELKKDGVESYPHKFNVTVSIPEYVATYSSLGPQEEKKDTIVGVAGMLPHNHHLRRRVQG
jgi:lysyl-tRNA synthetase class 2